MRDMLEMSRGVQHPVRGLFLRHYLSGQTRDYLPMGESTGPGGNLKDTISFVLTNFIEMNKLWVRLQFQGHSRDRPLREQERRELRILVGTNLVRLSQLEGIDLEMYKGQILPHILDQVIQCRDVLAQEYLMEVITQVFTDELHLRTLDQFLSATAKLSPSVNIKQIISAMIDRLADYAKREADSEDPEVQRQKEEAAANRLAAQIQKMKLLSTGNSEEVSLAEDTVPANGTTEETEAVMEPAHRFRGIPSDVKLFEVFWEQLVGLVKARPDVPIQDISALLVSLCNLALNCYPDRLDYVDKLLSYAKDKTAEFVNRCPPTLDVTDRSPDLHSPAAQNNFLSLLLAPLSSYSNLLTVLALPNYLKLLHSQTYPTRRAVAAAVCHSLLHSGQPISSIEDVQGVISLIRVLITEGGQPSPMPSGPHQRTVETEETAEEQGWLARLVHLFTNHDDLVVASEILRLVREAYRQGPGERCKYTTGSIITSAVKLIRRFKAREHIVPSRYTRD
jgi:vacuolar protein sorting-associated protein 35